MASQRQNKQKKNFVERPKTAIQQVLEAVYVPQNYLPQYLKYRSYLLVIGLQLQLQGSVEVVHFSAMNVVCCVGSVEIEIRLNTKRRFFIRVHYIPRNCFS